MRHKKQQAIDSISESFLDGLLQFIAILDVDGRVAKVNKIALDVSGVSLNQVQGQLFWECYWWNYDSNISSEIKSSYQQVIKGESVQLHTTALAAEGTTLDIDFKLAPVFEQGELVYIIASGVDISRKIEIEEGLRQQKKEFQLMANSMPLLAWMADETGYIFWYNQRWYDYTGTHFEEMKGWGWKKVHHPDHIDRVVSKITKNFATGEFWEDTFPLKSEDGKYRWFLSRAFPLKNEDGSTYRWFGTNVDITEELKNKDELRAITARLSEEIKNKDMFLATLSHELRNPLNSIVTGLDLIEHYKSDSKTIEEVSSTAKRQAKHLTKLVDDLLDLSRINTGKLKLQFENVDLQESINHAVDANREKINEAKQSLVIKYPSEPFYIFSDSTRLTQIFSNILNNATKYTPRGGDIEVDVKAEGEKVVIKIKDSGIGIPRDQQESIFNIFIQIEQNTGKMKDGLGIGLSLVKDLIESFDGEISVESEGRDLGTTVTLKFPLATAKELSRVDSPEQVKVKKIMKVLIAEDSPDANKLMQLMVRSYATDVFSAKDGFEAVEQTGIHNPDLILMDIGMPKMTGLEAARKIRELKLPKEPILVATSGWGQEEDRKRSWEAGFDHHLVKPIGAEKLKKIFLFLSERG